MAIQFLSAGETHLFKPTELKISFLPLLPTLETSCLASKLSSSTCSLFNFAPSSSDYCCTRPESQLCFNFQNPVHMTWARLQTANTCRTSGTTHDDLKSLKALLNKNPTFNIYDISNCREILKGDLYFALLWQSANTLKAIN